MQERSDSSFLVELVLGGKSKRVSTGRPNLAARRSDLSSLNVFSFDDSEFVSQHPIFGLKLRDARSNRRKSCLNLRLGKARRDVLRTIPIKRFEMQQKSALG